VESALGSQPWIPFRHTKKFPGILFLIPHGEKTGGSREAQILRKGFFDNRMLDQFRQRHDPVLVKLPAEQAPRYRQPRFVWRRQDNRPSRLVKILVGMNLSPLWVDFFARHNQEQYQFLWIR
jgi:hypothetical protein